MAEALALQKRTDPHILSVAEHGFCKRLIGCLPIFAILYTSLDTVLFGTNASGNFQVFGYALVFVYLILIMFYVGVNRLRVPGGILAVMTLFLALSFLTALANLGIDAKYLYEASLIVIAALYASTFSLERFVSDYVFCIVGIAAFSLVCYLLYMFVPGLFGSLPTVRNTAGFSFAFAGLSVVSLTRTEAFDRNFGIFREPGMFGVFLVIGLIFVLFRLNNGKRKTIDSLILLAAIFTTHSTGTYVTALLLLLIYLTHLLGRGLSRKRLLFALAVFACGVVAILTSGDFAVEEFSKIGNTGYSSWVDRTYSFTGNLSLFASSPFYGVGWQNSITQFVDASMASSAYSTGANTNTFLRVLAVHGIVFFVLWASGLAAFTKALSDRPLVRLLLFLLIFLLFSNENLTLNVMPLILVFYGCSLFKLENSHGSSTR